MPTSFQVKSYLSYWLDAVDEHSLHSPFFFDFYTKVVKASKDTSSYRSIEDLRQKLLANNTVVDVQELGAGSSVLSTSSRKVADIARTSLSSAKYSRLYARIVNYFLCRTIVELGTSFGINSLYLATEAKSSVATFEGVPAIVDLAQTTFEFYGSKNIALIPGDITKTLPTYLQRSGRIDLAFIDANHRYEPTRQYAGWLMDRMHTQSILILDDIHSSADMQKAWHELKFHSLVYGSADLYRCGILFLNPSLNKQHVVLQF